MDILFLSTWYPYPPDNGARIRAFHLLRALARAHRVTVVAFDDDRDDREGLLSVPEARNLNLFAVPEDPFRHVSRPQWVKFASPIPVAYWPSKKMREVVARAAGSTCWDVVVCSQVPVGQYSLQLKNVPRVLDIDMVLGLQLCPRNTGQRRLMARIRSWISYQKALRYEAPLLGRFHACTVVSDRELAFVRTMTSGRGCQIEVVPNGVDCETNRPCLAEPVRDALVYAGALTYSANYDAMEFFLSQVYPLIRRQVPGVTLTITGSTRGVDLGGLQIDNSVKLSGYVKDIRPLVAASAACVVPIRQGGGTRLKILEAMALGTPVVSTSKGAEGLTITPERDILIADEPTAFAAEVVRLLGDEGLRRQLARQARQLVEERYDWVEIGHRFVGLVERVANTQMQQEGKRA